MPFGRATAPIRTVKSPTLSILHQPPGRRGRAARTPLHVRPAWLWMLALTAGGLFLVLQAPSLVDGLGALASVDPAWVATGLALVIVRFGVAAVSLQAAVAKPIAFAPAVIVQLACSFVSRLTPEGVGWVILTQRYLECLGLTRTSALAAIGLKVAASGVSRAAIIAVVALAAGATGLIRLEMPSLDPLFVSVAAVALLGLALTALMLRAHAAAVARAALAGAIAAVAALGAIVRQPLRLVTLLATSAGLTILSMLVLAASVGAFRAEVLLIEVFVVYLASSAISALSPTPGNLGASELAFTAGLVAIGLPAAVALAAVLLYRILTFWLPVLPGLVAFRYLRARSSI